MGHPDFNAMTSAVFRADPYPILAELRESEGVVPLNPGVMPSWHVLRYADVQKVLLSPELFSSNRALQGEGELAEANLSFLFNNMISATGDKHRRLRMIGNRVFMPKFIESFRPALAQVVAAQMARALQGHEFDLVEEFSAQITVAMITRVLGLPLADMPQIRRWTAVLGDNSGASTWLAALDPEMVERGRLTGLEMTAYFREYLRERQANPREGDLISAFASVEVEGERLSESEVLSMVMLLLLAGNETTTNLITNFVRLLDAFPEQAARLRADPELTNPAVEETIRLRNSIRNIDRFALEDVELSGVTIPKGGLVVVWLSAANRDPSVFEAPDAFRPDRTANRHLGFGLGMHMCLGAALARMEVQLAARAILEQTALVELTAPPVVAQNANFDNITRQMARFHPR
ncbi:cytochrome P450 [Roseovarius faecimaris]|uniref:Cytochrome P450 n=1 Tax=Roseovarius faecimaris TaxID=2494550 RepID=A0A6I6ILW0_9RHOB|nr:cytochrome P450 [Roseovarius faecimaris]QGX96851.1 cytochrome P450 [Roseovarius faecimaris]